MKTSRLASESEPNQESESSIPDPSSDTDDLGGYENPAYDVVKSDCPPYDKEHTDWTGVPSR